jgi:hypothetical protein
MWAAILFFIALLLVVGIIWLIHNWSGLDLL